MADITQQNAVDLFTAYAILKDTRAADPNTAPRVAPSALIEYAAGNVKDIEAKVDALAAKLDALAGSGGTGPTAAEIADELAKRLQA